MDVPAKITIVTLGVADLDRSCRFYDRLGWRRSTESNEWIAWYATAGTVLGLTSADALAADAGMAPGTGDGFRGITLAINVDGADEVQPVLDAAQAAGGTIVSAASHADWGGVMGYFADPDGYAWEVVWSPTFPMDERGLLVLP